MKNLFTYFASIAILSIVISSCGSISVTKRQFNKGYSISYNKKMKSTESTKDSESIALKTESPKAIPNKKRNENIRSSEITPLRESEAIETAEIQEEIVPQSAPSSSEVGDNIIEQDELVKQESKNEQIQYNSDEDQVTSSTPRHDDGLSWIWIIILIVILLWALGLLFGSFGGLIHLLLVVALILLILWLLGII